MNHLPKNVSRSVLRQTPQRALKLLQGIATVPSVFATLAGRGYTQAEQDSAWLLLGTAVGTVTSPPDRNAAVVEATAVLEAEGPALLRRTEVALRRLYPDVATWVAAGLEPFAQAPVVFQVEALLDRLDALATDPERAATRETDAAAIALLAERGTDDDERQRLRELVAVAKGRDLAAPTPDEAARAAQVLADREAAQLTLRAWYEDWSEVARGAITRRDHLIRLGLAQRRVKKAVPPPAPPPPAPTPAPGG